MGEVIEAMAWIFGGIFWTLGTMYEKSTGRTVGLFGTLLLLVISGMVCTGVVFALCRLLFGA